MALAPKPGRSNQLAVRFCFSIPRSFFMPRHLLNGALATTLVFLISFAALGQQGRGSLRGTVTDELGAVVVGATVTLTDTAGQSKTAATTDGGAYVFNGLAPGKY